MNFKNVLLWKFSNILQDTGSNKMNLDVPTAQLRQQSTTWERAVLKNQTKQNNTSTLFTLGLQNYTALKKKEAFGERFFYNITFCLLLKIGFGRHPL